MRGIPIVAINLDMCKKIITPGETRKAVTSKTGDTIDAVSHCTLSIAINTVIQMLCSTPRARQHGSCMESMLN